MEEYINDAGDLYTIEEINQAAEENKTTFEDIISADISRYNIRKQNWLRLFAIWDASWNIENNEQVFAIYEEDNTNLVTFIYYNNWRFLL